MQLLIITEKAKVAYINFVNLKYTYLRVTNERENYNNSMVKYKPSPITRACQFPNLAMVFLTQLFQVFLEVFTGFQFPSS